MLILKQIVIIFLLFSITQPLTLAQMHQENEDMEMDDDEDIIKSNRLVSDKVCKK